MDNKTLAREVAEKVMGLQVAQGFNGKYYVNPEAEPLPDYPNDPAACFGPGGVVEMMLKKGWEVVLTTDYADKEPFMVSFCHYQMGQRHYEIAKTASRAICLAALKAVSQTGQRA